MHEFQQRILDLAKNQDLSRISLREIAKLIGYESESPGVLQHHFKQLEKKGLLFIDRKNKIQVLGEEQQDNRFYRIPLIGTASCGDALEYAEECVEGYIKISKSSFDKKYNEKSLISVRASGNSMNKAQVRTPKEGEFAPINDGDYVIVDISQKDPISSNGKYVLSVIGGMANIKKFAKRQYDIALLSESTDPSAYPPIYITPEDEYIINGRVIMVCKP